MPLRKFTPAEKVLSERRRMDQPLLVTVWLGAMAWSIGGGQWFYLAAATFAVTIHLLAVRRAMEVHVHRLFINLGVLCSTAILAMELKAGNWTVLESIGHYLILLQLCKLFERKSNRDYAQILALSALSMVAGSMIFLSPAFAILAAVYVWLLCHTAMIFTLKRGLEAAMGAQLATESQPPDVDQLAWNVIRTWPKLALRRRRMLILAIAAMCGIVVFVMSPRAGNSPKAMAPGRSGATTGFTEEVRLNEHSGRVYQSNSVLMQVRFSASPGGRIPAGPASYLRGATFGLYSDSGWSNPPADPELGDDLPMENLPKKWLRNTFVQEVSMQSSLLPHMFACYPTFFVEPAIGRPSFQRDLTTRLRTNRRPAHVRYKAYTISRPLPIDVHRALATLRRFDQAQLPADPTQGVQAGERVKQLARMWCDDLLELRNSPGQDQGQLDIQIARRIAGKLRKEYDYTLDLSKADPTRDGVEDFLFHMKEGHCEYFASAMTVLCRTLGVRARLATGFVPDEYDAKNDYYVIRGRDAHAWTEVYTPATDWIAIDATSSSGREMHGQTTWAPAKRFWARLEFLWYEKIVGYNNDSRRKLKEWAQATIASMHESLRKGLDNWLRDNAGFLAQGILDRVLVQILLLAGVIGAIVEGILLGRALRRRRQKRKQEDLLLPVPRKQMRFLREFTKLLQQHGLRREPSQTLREFAGVAAERLALPRRAVTDIVELSYRVRWGWRVPDRQELRRAEHLVAEMSARLSR